MRIAVAGATGRVGRHVVDVLETGGHKTVAMSRASGVDLVTGQGLANALIGVACIVDASSGSSPDQESATKFFTTVTQNLQEAGARAGVERIVVISIIGIDRFTSGYMAAKIAHEKAMLAGPLPVRILRAAQFHEFVAQIVEWGRKGDVSYVPKMRTQLVAARTVAQRLADLATDSRPSSGTRAPVLEIAGPRSEELITAATQLVTKRGDALRVEGVRSPDDPDGVLYETGALLPGPGAMLAGPTFAEWLETSLPKTAMRSAEPSLAGGRRN